MGVTTASVSTVQLCRELPGRRRRIIGEVGDRRTTELQKAMIALIGEKDVRFNY